MGVQLIYGSIDSIVDVSGTTGKTIGGIINAVGGNDDLIHLLRATLGVAFRDAVLPPCKVNYRTNQKKLNVSVWTGIPQSNEVVFCPFPKMLKTMAFFCGEMLFIVLALVGFLLMMGAKYNWLDYGIVGTCTLACILIAMWLINHEAASLAR